MLVIEEILLDTKVELIWIFKIKGNINEIKEAFSPYHIIFIATKQAYLNNIFNELFGKYLLDKMPNAWRQEQEVRVDDFAMEILVRYQKVDKIIVIGSPIFSLKANALNNIAMNESVNRIIKIHIIQQIICNQAIPVFCPVDEFQGALFEGITVFYDVLF